MQESIYEVWVFLPQTSLPWERFGFLFLVEFHSYFNVYYSETRKRGQNIAGVNCSEKWQQVIKIYEYGTGNSDSRQETRGRDSILLSDHSNGEASCISFSAFFHVLTGVQCKNVLRILLILRYYLFFFTLHVGSFTKTTFKELSLLSLAIWGA